MTAETATPCSFQLADLTLCEKRATRRVRTVLGVEAFCDEHAAFVAMVEQEWDEAERDYLEQP